MIACTSVEQTWNQINLVEKFNVWRKLCRKIEMTSMFILEHACAWVHVCQKRERVNSTSRKWYCFGIVHIPYFIRCFGFRAGDGKSGPTEVSSVTRSWVRCLFMTVTRLYPEQEDPTWGVNLMYCKRPCVLWWSNQRFEYRRRSDLRTLCCSKKGKEVLQV